jgi:hypothetical protein
MRMEVVWFFHYRGRSVILREHEFKLARSVILLSRLFPIVRGIPTVPYRNLLVSLIMLIVSDGGIGSLHNR